MISQCCVVSLLYGADLGAKRMIFRYFGIFENWCGKIKNGPCVCPSQKQASNHVSQHTHTHDASHTLNLERSRNKCLLMPPPSPCKANSRHLADTLVAALRLGRAAGLFAACSLPLAALLARSRGFSSALASSRGTAEEGPDIHPKAAVW